MFCSQKDIDAAKDAGNFHEQIRISENSSGHSYQSLFGHFLDCDVKSIHIEDPYIRAHHQIVNFLRFVELVIKKCSNIKKMHLVTKIDTSPQLSEEQIAKLNEICDEVKNHKIELSYEFSQSLHDRQIK